jgi:hypothetical protein
MNVVRALSGLAALTTATLFAAHLVKVFRPVILPTLRQLGREPTTFFARRADGKPINPVHREDHCHSRRTVHRHHPPHRFVLHAGERYLPSDYARPAVPR